MGQESLGSKPGQLPGSSRALGAPGLSWGTGRAQLPRSALGRVPAWWLPQSAGDRSQPLRALLWMPDQQGEGGAELLLRDRSTMTALPATTRAAVAWQGEPALCHPAHGPRWLPEATARPSQAPSKRLLSATTAHSRVTVGRVKGRLGPGRGPAPTAGTPFQEAVGETRHSSSRTRPVPEHVSPGGLNNIRARPGGNRLPRQAQWRPTGRQCQERAMV